MTQKNQYDLSREIPADVKRAVRQACGYGCVICGSAIIEYEHVDPTFNEAREHDPTARLCCQEGQIITLSKRVRLEMLTFAERQENNRANSIVSLLQH